MSGTTITIDLGGGGMSLPVKVVLLLTLLTLLPSLLLCLTSFTRIIIVMSLLRQALGLMHMPPNQVLIGLSLILTYFTMQPVLDTIHKEALSPLLEDRITLKEAIDKAVPPLKEFMLRQTREKELSLFAELSHLGPFENKEEIPMKVVVPAFFVERTKERLSNRIFIVSTFFGNRHGGFEHLAFPWHIHVTAHVDFVAFETVTVCPC